jgi:transposase-like protein
MTDNFKSLIELNDYFVEEKTCYEFLASRIWEDSKPICPHCNTTHVYTTKSRSAKGNKKDIPEYRCASKECGKKFTATVGTIFHASKLSLRTWYAAIFLITTAKKGISSLQLAAQLQITQKSAWHLLHRIREMFKETAPHMLKGIVEVDETFVGGKNKNRHENKKKGKDDKTPVLGLVERGGKILTFVVPNTRVDILQPIMVDYVETGSTVISDALQSYTGLRDYFNHVVVKKDTSTYKTAGNDHTNTIENFWSTFKRGIIGIYHYVSPKHLHRYTTEFGYRYNNRQDCGRYKFELAVTKAANIRLPYGKLIGKSEYSVYKPTIEIKEEKDWNINIDPNSFNTPLDFLDNLDPNDPNIPLV